MAITLSCHQQKKFFEIWSKRARQFGWCLCHSSLKVSGDPWTQSGWIDRLAALVSVEDIY